MILFDFRYVFKRNMHLGPELEPWTVPNFEKCANTEPEILQVPQVTESGASLNEHYEFLITPDKILFYSKYNKKKQLHPPFGPFLTRDVSGVIEHIKKQMEVALHPGFDERDLHDPIPELHRTKKMWFRFNK
jgi:hypothetical protein